MNKLILSLFILSILNVSCKDDAIPLNTKNWGKIENYDGKNTEAKYLLNKFDSQTLASVPIDSEGNFKIEYNSSYPHEIIIFYNKGFHTIAKPNETISLTIDDSKFIKKNNNDEGLKFNTETGNINNVLIRYAPARHAVIDSVPIKDHTKIHAPIVFKNLQDSLRLEKLKQLDLFISSENPDDEFITYAKASIDLIYYEKLLCYSNDYLNNYKHSKTEHLIPNSYYDFLDSMELNRSILISTESYYFLSSYISHIKSRIKLKQSKPENIKQAIFDELINHPKKEFRQLVLCAYIGKMINDYDVEIYQRNESRIKQELMDNPLFITIEERYHINNSFLEKPFNKDEALFLSDKNLDGEDLFNKIIESGKGKVIYIDCWGTWCGGCILDFPHANKLKQKYKKQDVEFVYLCFHSKESEWKKIVNDKKLTGKHYLLSSNQEMYFRKNYFSKNAYPNYIIVDKKSLVRFKGNEYRAANINTSSIIDNLLNE